MVSKNKKSAILLPTFFAIALIAGILIGINLNKKNPNDRIFIYPRNDNKLINLFNYVEEEYVDTVNKNELIEKTIPLILEQLDPHSVYIPASELKEINEPLEGNFEGIGVQFNMPNDTVIILNTISGGPSEKVGILAGDRIITIEDSVIAGKNISSNDIVKMLKGPKGTKVKVGILRKDMKDIIDFEITRDKIPLYSIDISYMITSEIGYIKISHFAKTTHKEFKDAINKLNSKGLKKLILDLRGNSGGLMDAATKIANEFLPENKLIVYTKGKARPKQEVYSKPNGTCLNKELIILIDEWSASASEILAGAIQDNDRGAILGRRSFGKGLVQQQTMFNDGSALRLTIARYYTPTGRSIQKPYGNGTQEYYDDLNQRYANGEFIHPDSIQFNDSLKFYTPKGKVVYGGGGIMPDIFVPYDTSDYTEYYKEITNKGLIYRFSFEYADNNRKKLSEFNNYKSLQKYLKSQKILNKFISYAENKGINKNQQDIDISKKLLETQLMASIARNILDNEGFYPIIAEIDYTLHKAIEIFKKK
ncbi:MAG: PDZ domain-containing protein [Bacteroidales bacterium]|nr:PDZ domain-containing protein [Bacteroidales bacterium]